MHVCGLERIGAGKAFLENVAHAYARVGTAWFSM